MTSGTTLNTPTFTLYGSQKEKRERKWQKNFFNEIIPENFPILEKKTDILIQKVQSLKQDES